MTEKSKLVPPCGYVGGKRKFAAEIAARLLAHRPGRVYDIGAGSGAVSLALLAAGLPAEALTMVEAGPWGWFWRDAAEGVLDVSRIRALLQHAVDLPPREVAAWVEQDVATQPPSSATFVVLQAASFGATPVWWDGTGWRLGERHIVRAYRARSHWEPGAGSTETKPRGTIFTPMRVADLVEQASKAVRGATVVCGRAEDLPPLEDSALAYIDPPYEGTSGYGATMDVPEVLRRLAGSAYVSEGRPLPGATLTVQLSGHRKGASLNGKGNASKSEWLSFFESHRNSV